MRDLGAKPLFCYAGWLFWVARRERIKSLDGWIAVALDLTWVLGSGGLLGAVPFSGPGKWAIFLVAEVVFAFALAQWLGLRRAARSAEPA